MRGSPDPPGLGFVFKPRKAPYLQPRPRSSWAAVGERGRAGPARHAWGSHWDGAAGAGVGAGRDSRGSPGRTVGDSRGDARGQWGTHTRVGPSPRNLPGAALGGGGVPGPAGAVLAPAAAPGFSWEISPSPPDVSPVPGCRRRGRAGGRAGRTGRPAAPVDPAPSCCRQKHPRSRWFIPISPTTVWSSLPTASARPSVRGRGPEPAPGAVSCSWLHGPCPLHFLTAGARVRGGRIKEGTISHPPFFL